MVHRSGSGYGDAYLDRSASERETAGHGKVALDVECAQERKETNDGMLGRMV